MGWFEVRPATLPFSDVRVVHDGPEKDILLLPDRGVNRVCYRESVCTEGLTMTLEGVNRVCYRESECTEGLNMTLEG